MDPNLMQALKQQLLEDKKRVKEELDSFDTDRSFIEESVGELNSVDQQHPADTGTELYEREKDMAFHRRAEEELSEIEHALEKMENGTYGICERTGRPIPEERLKAMPTARYVIDESQS
ncbi:TraR/DksA C4-type zinc finger protein [Piscibacillus halophilus]|uniref:Transcriptional regulator, TraR/DksA family n=1 Tax=Piscibacillus halophilus TaxID=571933 RepID=A0A1H9JIR6_9BACI|nr:TraR/DksA C4-type zinc finger protein [Piscibacillus halophilus]SEQ86762.1 transcriptional regulator, TraR/DksA family [Piscibacillus halophilus]